MTRNPPEFTLVRRGYARGEVERFLLDADGRPPGPPPQFTVAAKGYDRDEVDAFITSLGDPSHPGAAAPTAPGPGPGPETAPDPARRWWRRRR